MGRAVSFSVSVNELKEKKAEMEDTLKAFDESVGEFDVRIKRMDDSWDGDASEAYISRMVASRDRLQESVNNLRGYVVALNEIINNYEAVEDQAIAEIGHSF